MADAEGAAVAADTDWLVLSLKWSQEGEWLVWYRPAASGYTTDVGRAGRFTEAQARGHERAGVTMAVPLAAAMREAQTRVLVPRDAGAVGRLAAASEGAYPS